MGIYRLEGKTLVGCALFCFLVVVFLVIPDHGLLILLLPIFFVLFLAILDFDYFVHVVILAAMLTFFSLVVEVNGYVLLILFTRRLLTLLLHFILGEAVVGEAGGKDCHGVELVVGEAFQPQQSIDLLLALPVIRVVILKHS